MYGNLGRQLTLATLVFVFALPSEAFAQASDHAQCGTTLPACSTARTNCCTRNFESSTAQKAIVIPLDRCHQKLATSGPNVPPSGGASSPAWCVDEGNTNTNAMNRAYGLVYRLVQNNIPVYWIVNPTKAPSTRNVNESNTSPATTPDARTKDVDFWIVSTSGAPPAPTGSLTAIGGATAPVSQVVLSNPGTASASFTLDTTYSRHEFPVRGGAFLIAPDDRAAFDAFHQTQLGRTTCGSGNDCYDFREVNYYEVDPSAVFVWQDYTKPLAGGKYVEKRAQLPVAMRMDYEPPKVAVVDGNALPTILAAANLDDLDTGASCTAATAFAAKRVGCRLTEAEVVANELGTGGFNTLWMDGPNSSASCTTTNARVRAFLTAVSGTTTGGNVTFFNRAIQTFGEACTGDRGYLGSTAGLNLVATAVNETSNDPIIVRYPSNLFAQGSDTQVEFASGTVSSWNRLSGSTNLYHASYDTAPSTLRRLFTLEKDAGGTDCSNHKDTHVVGAASTAGCDNTGTGTAADILDIFAYGRYQNVADNGVVFYSPGTGITPPGNRVHLLTVLGSLLAMPAFIVDQTVTNIDVARGSPIIGQIGTVPASALIQGTFEFNFDVGIDTVTRTVPRNAPAVFVPDDIAGFTFPATKGHLRATRTSSIGTGVEDLDDNTGGTDIVFDAGGSSTIPPVTYAGCGGTSFTTGCRNMWTNTTAGFVSGGHAKVDFNTSNAATLGPILLPDAGTVTFNTTNYTAFIQRVMQGWNQGGTLVAQMGGIDHSTVFVVPPGTSIGGGRPTVAYVGSTDGMLHAICTETRGACVEGRELWAYIPRVNLPSLRFNTARVASSPRVIDVKAAFDGPVAQGYTVLIFSAGSRADVDGETPAVYCLDITDPTRPRLIWEYATFKAGSLGLANNTTGATTYTVGSDDAKTPGTRGAYALGEGLTLAVGQAQILGIRKNLVIAQTNNGGTGAAANYVVALDIDTGTRVWERVNTLDNFFAPRVAPTINVPATGIPPGAIPIDKTLTGTNGFMTDIVVGDLYGNLWLLDPADGSSQVNDGATPTPNEVPLFQFTTDYHPIALPAIYAEGGTLFAAFATGGYVDFSSTKLWGTNTTTQYGIAVNLDTPSGAGLPLRETPASGNVPINIPLVNQGLSFSQARIVGTEVFFTTDTGDVNAPTFGSSTADTGRVIGYNFATDLANAVITTRSGATNIVNDGAALFASGGGKRQRLGTDAAGTIGDRTVATEETTSMIRRLWLRTE
jgi:hypothetical protein